MTEGYVRGGSIAEAYHAALLELKRCGRETPVSFECAMTILVESPLSEPMISRLFFGGPYDLERYRQEMLDGILDFEVERGNWAYTYHQRYGPYIDRCIEELKRDPWSRRAVISVRDNEDDYACDDPACLQSIQYMIRGGKLDCFVLFRSNDAAKASFMNMFALVMLQKRVADALGVPVGTYAHRANSYHIYKRDYDLFDGYIARLNSGEDCTFDYADEWEDLMLEARPEVDKMLKELKGNG